MCHQKWLIHLTTLVVLLSAKQSTAIIEDVIDVIRLGKEVTSSVLETWQFVEQTNLVNEVEVPFLKQKQKKILTRMTDLSRQIALVEDKVIVTILVRPNKCVMHIEAIHTKKNRTRSHTHNYSYGFISFIVVNGLMSRFAAEFFSRMLCESFKRFRKVIDSLLLFVYVYFVI